MNESELDLRTALASFPRSGNTWVRFLLETAIGKECGSIYKDRIMPRSAAGIAIKTHALDSTKYDRAIHAVRNPLDVIESYFFWKRDVKASLKVTWEENVRETTANWREHCEHWLAARCPVHRVRYEDLKTNTAEELTAMVRWLGYDVPPTQIEAAVAAGRIENMRELNGELGDKFFRRGEVGKSRSSFTAEQLAFVRSELRDLIVQLGYGDLTAAVPG